MTATPNALLRRGDGLYEPLTVYELCEDRIAPDRIVLSVEINSGHTPLGKPLPANLVVARRTARLTCWLGDPWWCRPVYVEDRP